ncbi:alpha/beta hydrolase family protein [Pararcticibacter amylolyticus]|uniref:Alpha/beta hydrolase n=1 Tax=Pararcticibacter amylolyticus TaxID=2173175 RepID=A0A2U2PCR3_9SPHI|nr:alpha/beta fold hydrolase [Pararcticibacter amylolyticus]PWG79153.1 alpha/beta hydrolase [Pararcticibacter amylolyticus]
MNKIEFTIQGASGRPIHADITSPEDAGSFPLVIFVHGFKGFKDWGTHHLTAGLFAGEGFRFLKFNFSHAGISQGGKDTFDDLDAFSANTFTKELFDLDQVITRALSGEDFPPPGEIFLIGHSLGGGISIIQTAEDKRVDKLVTWAAVGNFRSLWSNEQEESWRKDGVLYFENKRTNQQMPIDIGLLDDLNHHSERLNVLNAARTIRKPWLIVHGDADSSIPVQQAEELNRQQEQAQLLLVPDADHVFGAKHPWTDDKMPDHLHHVCMETIAFLREQSS